MKDLFTYATDEDSLIAAMNATDEGKRYKPRMTRTKVVVLLIANKILARRLNDGKRAHALSRAQVVELLADFDVSVKVARLAIELAIKIGLIKAIDGGKYSPVTGTKSPTVYQANFDFFFKDAPRRIDDLRNALVNTGEYGENLLDAYHLVENELEALRMINLERGNKTLTVSRALDLLVERDTRRWERIVKRTRYFARFYDEDQTE